MRGDEDYPLRNYLRRFYFFLIPSGIILLSVELYAAALLFLGVLGVLRREEASLDACGLHSSY